jgi:hypothetical protein
MDLQPRPLRDSGVSDGIDDARSEEDGEEEDCEGEGEREEHTGAVLTVKFRQPSHEFIFGVVGAESSLDTN